MSRSGTSSALWPTDGRSHSWHEDVLAILIGTLFVSLGVVLYAKAMLLTGGIAGLTLLLSYATPVNFWTTFFVLNLPFCWFAARRKGRGFIIRTLLAIALECFFVAKATAWIDIVRIDPIYAAIAGGALIGIGLMGLFRHNTSLGGLSTLAMCLQECHGIRAGYVQFGFDALVLLAATQVLPVQNLILSLVGAGVMNGVLVVYHRPDRYVGFT